MEHDHHRGHSHHANPHQGPHHHNDHGQGHSGKDESQHDHPAPQKDQQAHHTSQHDHSAHGSHDKHAGHHTGDFLKRFWICLILTIPVLLLSHMVQQWLGFELRFGGSSYI